MVRAKFYVASKTEHKDTPEHTFSILMNPVVSGSPENKEFYKWTPSGNLEFRTINGSAAAQFTVGKEFYLDFTPAE